MKEIQIGNKFYKNNLLIENKELENLIPETKVFNETNFWELMNKYKKVVVKPSKGSEGLGVILVTEIKGEEYKLNILNQVKYIEGKERLFQYLKKKEKVNTPNIVQYYIPLAKIVGKPIDLRYILQRKKDNVDWVITGRYAKIAKSGYIVTNFKQGAEIVTVEDALAKTNIKDFNVLDVLLELDSVAISIAKCLSTHFPNHMIWGCDLAIDENGSIWIIEVNSSPGIQGFLEGKTLLPMYKTINKYKKMNKPRRRRSIGVKRSVK